MTHEPGFDFIKLTRPQWRHLARVQRRHGIPWHQYIKILIQRDMDRSVNGEEIRPAPMEGKKEITPDSVNRLITKIEELLSQPMRAMPSYLPETTGKSVEIVEEEHVKPSELKKVYKPVKPFPPGTRMSLMDELHQKLGLPPPENRKINIQISEYVTIDASAAPDPPRIEEEEE